MINVDTIKALNEILKKANRLDLAEEITSLREELVTIKEKNIKVIEENSNIKKQLELKSKIIYEKGICWIIEDEMKKDKSNTAICPICWQIDKIVLRIEPQLYSYGPNSKRRGINCRKGHGVSDIVE